VGRGGLPRCSYYSRRGAPPAGDRQPPAPLSQEEELSYLKNRGRMVKEQLSNLDLRIHDLEDKD
jgi:hypothetical protein